MDSNETKNRLKDLIGIVGYSLFRRYVKVVQLKIDADKKLVTITKDGTSYEISFDEIEQFFNDFS